MRGLTGRALPRWPAGLATLALVFAASGSAPSPAGPVDEATELARCRQAAEELAARYRNTPDVGFSVACAWPDGTALEPEPAAPIAPAPVPVTTAGHAGCVTGPGRPVAGTVLTTASARGRTGEVLLYEYQELDGGESVMTSGVRVLAFGPGQLAPGRSYRWRARVDDTWQQTGAIDGDRPGWSPWCEFTVSPAAVDYTQLGDVSLEALHELRLRPDRRYAVTLTRRQQRLLREGTDVGRTRSRMTLTGPRWTDLLLQLTENAVISDEVAAELAGEESVPPDGTAYRRLVDAISVELGGPAHPDLA